MRRFLTLFALTLCIARLSAQAPGGVTTGLVVWLKADAGTSSTTDGALLSGWNDQSGLSNHAFQATASAQPRLKTNAFNGNSVIETTNSRFFNVDLTDIHNSRYTIFTVLKRANTSGNQYFLGAQQLSSNSINMGFRTNTRLRFSHNAATTESTVVGFQGTAEVPRLIMMEHTGTAPRALSEVNDGTTVTSSVFNLLNYPVTTQGRIGRGNSTSGFTGQIAEVIIYNRALTTNEKRQVQSYLAVKYGITINNSDHVFYNDATYRFDVCGIGRNMTTQGLNQTTSSSESSDDMVEISNASSLNDGDYLVIGNNNNLRSFQLLTPSNCAVDSVMQRVWRVKETGDVGTVTLRFDLGKMAAPFNPNTMLLMVDRNNNGYADELPIAGTYNAPFLTFQNVQLENNFLFTLGAGRVQWFAVTSGNSNGAIWSRTPTGAPQVVTSWCSRTNASILPGVTVNVNSSLMCRHLIIPAGATLNTTTSNITVHGNITADGTFNAGAGSVFMGGSSPQEIGGTQAITFNNLFCSNGSTVSITGPGVNMRSVLQINAGMFHTNNKLTLLSNGTDQGSIGPLAGDITGNVVVQRRHVAPRQGWLNIAAPASGQTVQSWDDDLITSGFPGSDFPNYNFNNVYYYNESVAGSQNNGFVGVTNITNSLLDGRGYFVFTNAGTYDIDVNGPIFKRDITLNTSYTNTGSAVADGWNLVTNPYPSAIDWNSASWTKTNIDNAVYVWNAAISQYSTYIGGVATNGGSNIIPSSQSFFVFANAASPELTLRENCKSTAQGTFKSRQTGESTFVTLKVSNGTWSDETLLEWTAAATEKYDPHTDAFKLRSMSDEVPYLASSLDGNDFSIQALNASDEEQVIGLKIQNAMHHEYVLTYEGLEGLFGEKDVILEHVATGAIYNLAQLKQITVFSTDVEEEPNYRLHIVSKGATASLANPMNEVAVLTEEGARISFGYSEPRDVQINIFNMIGQTVVEPTRGVYTQEVLYLADRATAANTIVEIIDLATGERSVHRLGN